MCLLFVPAGGGRRGRRGWPFDEGRSDIGGQRTGRAERHSRRGGRRAEDDDGPGDSENGSAQGTFVSVQFGQVSVDIKYYTAIN